MNAMTLLAAWGWQEIGLVLLVALILFGGSQLPKIARNLGKGIKEFKKGIKEIDQDIQQDADTTGSSSEKDKQSDGR